ncbi:MAG: hypothetical protein IT256_06905, partial [Chitinophagaceae bacterium]|nr:hypothetical protein [Chitinophagaceae bacterium]
TAFKDGKLYIGGNFTKVGGTVESKSVAMYDGKKWSSVGNAKFDRAVTSMAFLGNDLYVAGIFTLNGDEPMERFAKWDGKVWTEAVPGGLNGIETMVADGNNLIIGGKFGVKLFDGKALVEIPNSPTSGNVFGVCADGGKIYIAGDFRRVKVGKKDVETYGFASWDGKAWTAYPEIPYTVFRCVAVYNGVLYAGGEFNNAFNGITKWENGAWTKVQN